MQDRQPVWPWILTLALGVLIAVALVQSDLLTRISYAAEKGRLQADREQLYQLAAQGAPSDALSELSRAFRLVARNVSPAVVNIDTRTSTSSLSVPEELRGPFRRNLPPDHPDLGSGEMIETGRGSGMIVDAQNGFVLTNHHVVAGADVIRVTLEDGRQFQASLVGADTMTDMAVIRIDAPHLHQVEFGNSDDLEVGDFVLAIGSPFGYSQSVSHGIVSAKGRTQFDRLDYTNFIQTDASINPGNSGGPLVNLLGQVVGMNTAIATRTGADSGIGFAIPANRITAWLPDLVAGRPVVRGYLGAFIKSVRQQRQRAAELGWDESYGVLIPPPGALEGGPAERAGIKTGDIIVAIDGKRTDTAADLQEIVARARPGTEVAMRVWRDGRLRSVRVRVEEQPQDFRTQPDPRRTTPPQPDSPQGPTPIYTGELGLDVHTLDSDLAQRFGWQDEPGGVVVTNVQSDGTAHELIKPGDLILKVQGDPVRSATDFWRKLQPQIQDDNSFTISIKRPRIGRRDVVIRPRHPQPAR